MIAVGTMISLAYYLRVIAAVWMRPAAERTGLAQPTAMPAMAGGSQEADPDAVAAAPAPDGSRCLVVAGLTVAAAAATVFFGVIPSPLVDWAANAGESIGSLLG